METKINSKEITLGSLKKMIEGIDISVDPSTLSSEELLHYHTVIALTMEKLVPLTASFNFFESSLKVLKKKIEDEDIRRNEIFTVIDDGTGEQYYSGETTIEKITIDSDALAKAAGLDASVKVGNPAYAKFYTRSCKPRYNRKAILQDSNVANDPSIVKRSSYKQGTFLKTNINKEEN